MPSLEHLFIESPYQSHHFSCYLLLWCLFFFGMTQHQPVSSLSVWPNDYPFPHPLKNIIWICTKVIFITLYRHDIFQFIAMNLEFPIVILITWRFQFSLDFSLLFFFFLVNIGILIRGLGLFMQLRNHFPPISFNKIWHFPLKSSGVFFTYLGIFWILNVMSSW